MFYHNAELRVKLFNFNSYLVPGSFGIIGFNDLGRVWTPNEAYGKWHHGYGGGIYIIPADLLLIQAVIGFSEERVQPYFAIGFQF
jgi:outer membrane translocation and assembly module TamA